MGAAPDPRPGTTSGSHNSRLLIEYDVQEPLTATGGGHVHALTRDPVNDYGIDWLGLRYTDPHRWSPVVARADRAVPRGGTPPGGVAPAQ